MKVLALSQLLDVMPQDADVVLADPAKPGNTVTLDGYFLTHIDPIYPPSHLVLRASALEARQKQEEELVAVMASQDPRR